MSVVDEKVGRDVGEGTPASRGGVASRGSADLTSDKALARFERATAGLQAPFALIDLDAMWTNAEDLIRRAGSKPIRLASKSVRCRALQERVLAREGFRGTLAFTLPEALWLASHGAEDLLVAYPTADSAALRALLANEDWRKRVTVMVDSVEQIDLIDRATRARAIDRATGARAIDRATGARATRSWEATGSHVDRSMSASPVAGHPDEGLRVCIDLDAGWRALGGRVRVGVKRSPVHTPAQAAALAREVCSRPGLRLVGVMAYEAQIAGVGDSPPGRPRLGMAIRAMQALSARELAPRRAAAVAAVEQALREGVGDNARLELVNGGGTGSLERTAAEPAITEVTAGSGLYGPALFDAYRAFAPRPAAMFALPVVRRPGPGVATVLGGGYLASGSADAARLPRPYLPSGLRLDRREGAGEVQTPLLGVAADGLALGDCVYLRHAKAGELCERFSSLHLIEGDRIVDEVPTYRGEGQCFL